MFTRRAAILAAAFGLSIGAAQAQTYPTRPVTMVIPFAAGGPTDVVGRIIADQMSRSLGQTVVVENVVGASGQTASLRVSRADPDGYSFLIGHTGTHAAAVALNPKLRYDPLQDFTPVGLVNTNPILVVSRKDLPSTDLKSLVAYLKEQGSKVTNAHAGIGSVSHTTCLLFNSIIGVKPTEVPYRGTGPAMNDIMGGQVDYLCDQIVGVAPQAQAGTIKAYAVAQKERAPSLPDTPTTAEAGLPEYQVQVWNAMFLPKNTPQPIVDKLNAALVDALNHPNTKTRFAELGADVPEKSLSTPAGLQGFVKAEIDRWTPVIKKAGVTMGQ
ncbi:tripartite tricarboxylate transporter substrate-binding protein [Enterovirga rhinocerotis]|uniref:Tripartite-type tricarboxylate transporter receptor subunit TctC n=1 Tax=Enterovirga rhinocerotis TaxID=1339210 RepID=A0A4R7C062_9HYPH|nr:tripartite tricarboxylate transporter substrate-binding protein [Enterovirga rhinocerotis]TDR90435.1 tripartite-type tricarboxylate transporter receptor subunit TctC [Enterovirga rhinocerotis]